MLGLKDTGPLQHHEYRDWVALNERLLGDLISTPSVEAIWGYKYHLARRDSPIPTAGHKSIANDQLRRVLLKQAKAFFKALARHRKKYPSQPLLLIGQGLGGVLLQLILHPSWPKDYRAELRHWLTHQTKHAIFMLARS